MAGDSWSSAKSAQRPDADWTDDGQVHLAARPKGGPRNAIRRTPIPPVLVTMLREHIQAHGTAADGRLFQTDRGGIYLPSTLWRVLQEARLRTFSQAQLASARPADPTISGTPESPGGSTQERPRRWSPSGPGTP
jgi:hypothetical protein